ncbi:unnamed protein product [Arabis nemorensis]|uniref:Uncharacterized protein n=1 Tax=Arabis nemorensis TaxID=586526 RepID=A0A565BLK9_9BRAS|nr:unnamed protein product [Arabis nemorensis]
MEYEEEMSEFNTSEVDWGDNTNNSREEGEAYHSESWDEKSVSEISSETVDEREEKPWTKEATSKADFGEDPEQREDREPYEDSRTEDGDSQNRYGDEQWREEEEIIYDGYERESQFSLEEDYFSDETYPGELNHDGETSNEDKPWCEETNSQDSLEGTEQYGEETWHHEAESEASFEGESYYGEEDHEPRYITFSGHGHGSEACLRWVRDMEEWFSYSQIPEEEKTNCAEETLTEDAYRHWDRDAYQRLEYDEPAAIWEEMKQLISDEFVRDVDNMRQYYSRIYTNPEPTRWILATRPKPKATPKRYCSPKPKKMSTHEHVDMDLEIQKKIVEKEEEPPDGQHQLHLSNTPALTRDPTILRTKSSQGGGYDAVIKHVAGLELHQTYHSNRIGFDKDICAFLREYRINHEDSEHQTTWETFSAQRQKAMNLNQPNRSSDEGEI